MSDGERTFHVEMLSRVEGEGRFHLSVEGGQVRSARLEIFEAPRYFEALLRGRSLFDVPDIVARICGICPVAYQMSSVRALERALGFDPPVTAIRRLRRLLYCGEWIESHTLHVYMLHAPDYLGYPSAIAMASDHPELVERGLRMKKAGNALIEMLGGRAVHPVSPRVGGFSRVPTGKEMRSVRPMLAAALEEAKETVEWTRTLSGPRFEQDYVFVALKGPEYPLEWGDALAVSGREPIPVDEFESAFVESHVEYSNALQCRLRDGTPYLVGPMARLSLFADKLHDDAVEALERAALPLPVQNPYDSITVRAIELVHAFAEALDIIDAYERPAAAYRDVVPTEGTGAGCTEAPRGACWHRYAIDNDGLVTAARIVPPTSQNQARIEQDLESIAPQLLAEAHDVATRRCEQLIRAYDPCSSCATHFLTLDIERLPSPPEDRP